MKTLSLFFALCVSLLLFACNSADVSDAAAYQCTPDFADSSARHPRAAAYRAALEAQQREGQMGMVMLVKDRHGLWQGAAGWADRASDAPALPCQPFLIASISKVFTATLILREVERGTFALDDRIAPFLDAEMVAKIANAEVATFRQLLAHRSGIADHYTVALELSRINREANGWTAEDMLGFIYGKPADFDPDATYSYSNSNYILLGLIIERVTGFSLGEAYKREIFAPLGLESAFFGKYEDLPAGTQRGYVDVYDDGRLMQSDFLYRDELLTGDGGIAINAHDLAVFIEQLHKGALLNAESRAAMFGWFDLPEFWVWEDMGQTRNGLGVEYFDTPDGYAIGHTGGIDGLASILLYWPESDRTLVIYANSANLGTVELYQRIQPMLFD